MIRIMILALTISELAQLIFIAHHLNYYSSLIKNCPMDELLEGGVGNNFVAFFYRAFTVYIPLITIIWTLWVPKSKVNIVFKEVILLKYNLLIVYRVFLRSVLTRHLDMLLDFLLTSKDKVHQRKLKWH